MDNKDLLPGQAFAANVQARLVMMMVGALIGVAIMLLLIETAMIFQKFGVDQGQASLLNTVVNALVNLASIGVGFWLARQRAPHTGDDGSSGAAPGPLESGQPTDTPPASTPKP